MKLRLGALRGIALAGSGTAFPKDLGLGAEGPRALTNEDAWRLLLGAGWREELARRSWDPERPERVQGVARREWLHRPGQTAVSERGAELLAVHAARVALEDARLSAQELELVVVATSTPDRIGSTLSARVAMALGSEAAGLDARAGGAGGVEAWLCAASLVAAGARHALVVAVEVASAYLHAGDLGSGLLFGDGASAFVLRADATSEAGLVGACLTRAPAQGRPFTVPGPLPPSAADLAAGGYRFQPADAEYGRALDDAWRALGARLRAAHPRELDATRYVLAGAAHEGQAQGFARALGLEPARLRTPLAEHGATGSAAIGIALDGLRREAAPRAGELLVAGAVGGGIHAAGLIWRN